MSTGALAKVEAALHPAACCLGLVAPTAYGFGVVCLGSGFGSGLQSHIGAPGRQIGRLKLRIGLRSAHLLACGRQDCGWGWPQVGSSFLTPRSTSPFRLAYPIPPEIEAGAMVSEVVKRGYKKLAWVSVQNPVIEQIDRDFDRKIAGKAELIINETFSPESTDFRSVLARIKKAEGIDAIAVNLLPAAAGAFTKQPRQLGLSQDFFSAEILESPDAIALSGGALEGQWYVTYANPKNEFLAEFKSRYPTTIVIGAANCFDAVQLIAQALQSRMGGDASDSEAVTSWLSSLKHFEGAMGTFAVRADRTFAMPAGIRIVRGAGYEQIRVYEDGQQ